MDLLRAMSGAAVAIFMMVAPQLGLPFLQPLSVPLGQDAHEEEQLTTTLARMEVEVGERVQLLTLDEGGNRTSMRVLWAEVEGEKLEKSGQGQGKLQRVKLAAASPGAFKVGNDTLRVLPGDEVTIEGFDGKWAYRFEGMVGVLRLEGSVLNARTGEKGLRSLNTAEQSVPQGWALSGKPLAEDVTVRAGRTAFVSTEARVGEDVVKQLRARDVRVNGARVEGTKWGEGPLDSIAFTALGPGALKGEGSDRAVQEGQRVEVADFIGAYVIFHTSDGESRIALEGYAGSVNLGPAQALSQGGSNRAPVAGFDWTPSRPMSGQAVKFFDRSSDLDGLLVQRRWNFGDGNVSTEANPSHAFEDDGTFQVTLTVTDNRQVTATIVRNLTIQNAPPLVSWDANPRAPSKLDRVQFVDGSRDPDGRVIAWAWDFGDGSTSREAHPVHQFPGNGRYTVALTVWDDDGTNTTFSKSFEVRNLLPQARFTWLPVAPLSGEPIRFRDASSDQDGTIVAWRWDFGDGSTSHEQHPVHGFLAKGPHRVVLMATDDDGGTHSHDSVVDVANSPPEASFTVDPSRPGEGMPARFTDTSTDRDGRVVERLWSFGDGSVSTETHPSHTYLTGGNVTVSLTVRDDDGARTTALRTLSVNRRPIAGFSVSPAVPTTQGPARFNDTSVDLDGGIASWSWDFGDGTSSTDRHPQHLYARPGTYTVTLAVLDHDGARGQTQRSLNVSNAAPVADFTWEPAAPSTSLPLTFRDASSDPDGRLVAWSWTFGDGAAALGNPASHRYLQGGVYNVTLLVTDDTGATATKVKTLRVNQAPEAAFTLGPAAPDTVSDVTFTDTSLDLDGSVVAWAWSFGDGATSSVRSPAHRYLQQGTYVARLVVTDNEGALSNTSRTVVVGGVGPRAAFEVLTAQPMASQPVRFQDASTDADGRLNAWRWEFGDGSTSALQHPEHTYAAPGTYRVRLNITDDQAKTSSAERQVRVLSGGPLEVFFRVVYPDGTPFDVHRDGVSLELRETVTNVKLTKAEGLVQDAGGVVRGTLGAGEWGAADTIAVALRMNSAFVDRTHTAQLAPDGDLGTFVVPIGLKGTVTLLPGDSATAQGAYGDPVEPIQGTLRLVWRDGVPARHAQASLRYQWEQLGAPKVPLPAGVNSGETADDGTYAFVVPFTLGGEGGGAYLPGQYRALARGEVIGVDGLSVWEAPILFRVDPGGVVGNL